MWKYKEREIKHLKDFGDPLPFGFVYNITHIPSGKSYIGKKVLIYNSKKKLTKRELLEYESQKGRKPKYKLIQKESNWKNYWGSNKVLLELVEIEPTENFDKIILEIAPNKKLLTYYETYYQFYYRVLENPNKYFNDQILGKFYVSDFKL